MKEGDLITMYLHGAGVVSQDKYEVLQINGNVVTIDDCDGRKFDMKTGRCLNDNNFCGFYRTIDRVND